MQSVILLNVVILSVVMLNVVIPSVVMLNVVASLKWTQSKMKWKWRFKKINIARNHRWRNLPNHEKSVTRHHFIFHYLANFWWNDDESFEISCTSTDGTTTLGITTFSTTLSITIKIATLSIMAFNVVILSVLCWVSQITQLCRVSSCWVLWRHRDIWICKNINFDTSAFKFKSFVYRHHYNNFWSLKRNYNSKPSVYAVQLSNRPLWRPFKAVFY